MFVLSAINIFMGIHFLFIDDSVLKNIGIQINFRPKITDKLRDNFFDNIWNFILEF